MTTVWDGIRAVLLPDVKNYLDITWDDDAVDTKVWNLTVGGMSYLDGKIGEPQDYTGTCSWITSATPATARRISSRTTTVISFWQRRTKGG